MISCDLKEVDSEITACSQASSFLPSAITEDQLGLKMSDELPSGSFTSSSVSIIMDNSLSPGHTLVQIICKDHKALLYDIMRTFKDYNIQVNGLICILHYKYVSHVVLVFHSCLTNIAGPLILSWSMCSTNDPNFYVLADFWIEVLLDFH